MRQAIQRRKDRIRQSQQQFAANLQLAQMQEEIRRVEQFSDRIGEAFADAATEVVIQSDNILDTVTNLVDSILQQIARMVFAQTVGRAISGLAMSALGGGIPDAPGAIPEPTAPDFSGFPGFQHGGRFKVGGTGGTDSQLVAFRASPGETVTVVPEAGGGGGGGTVVNEKNEVNLQVTDVDSFRKLLSRHRQDLWAIFRQGRQQGAL